MLLVLYLLDPYALKHLWHGRLTPAYLYAVLIPFILFELWVHRNISRALRLDRDLPVFRRYLGVLIETSMPTIVLALHIDSMGRVEALGFVAPFIYFIFIILSTLRLDFWLSTFTGFVAAAELFCMAMFYNPAGGADPPPDLYYHSVRSVVVLIAACWRVPSGFSCAGNSRPAFWRRPRATASPICSASTSRRRWSNG